MFCERCGKKMNHILSFSREKNQEFFRCPKCKSETIKVPFYLQEQIKQNKDCEGRNDH